LIYLALRLDEVANQVVTTLELGHDGEIRCHTCPAIQPVLPPIPNHLRRRPDRRVFYILTVISYASL
jgi:hypothetical protein